MNKILTEKQQRRYDRILRRAEELIYENGFYKLSLSELTEELKISRSTIYENFGSKDGLIEKVVEAYNQRLNEGLKEIITDKSIKAYDKFIAIAQQLTKNSLSKTNYKFHRDLKAHTPHLYDQYLEGRQQRVTKIYKPLIEEGIKAKLFDKSLDKEFLLHSYLEISRLLCETTMLDKIKINKAEGMDIITRIFLNGAQKI